MPTKKYNPGFLSDDELVSSFRVRSREFRSMVETVRASTGNSNTHVLVIGPRGSGKTTVLLRFAIEVRRDHDLSSRFFPIVFAEESYSILTCGEFWLEALNRLADQAPSRTGDPDYRRTYEELRKTPDDRTLAGRCLGRLLEFADRERKRLVLIVENLNAIFADIAGGDVGWQLRHPLQTEPRILLVCSATSRFDAIDVPSKALYGFFQVRKLRPLDENECTDLWEGVAGVRPARATIRSLQILTGGSPRLLAIVARFGSSLSFDELMRNLLDLVDEHTEHFRSHLESLPHQERRVFLALAGLWRPSTTREIADQTRLSTNQCSAQLKRLEELGAVSVVGGSPRRKQYYLTERMLNIYYLLRLRGSADDLVRALVRFMQAYYSLPELVQIAGQIAQTTSSPDSRIGAIARETLAQLVEGMPRHLWALFGETQPIAEPFVNQNDQPARSNEGRQDVRAAQQMALKAQQLFSSGGYGQAIEVLNGVVMQFGTSSSPDLMALVGMALTNRGAAYLELNRFEDALDTFEDVEVRFRHHKSAKILELVAMAPVNKGMTLGRLNRSNEALESYQAVVKRIGSEPWPEVRELVACALFQCGVLLAKKGQGKKALQAYENLFHGFGADSDPGVIAWVARGLVNKGGTLGRLGCLDEARLAHDAFGFQPWKRTTVDMKECAAQALLGRAWTLEQLNRPREALATYNEALAQFESQTANGSAENVARSLLAKGDLLVHLSSREDALQIYNELESRFGNAETLEVARSVASGLVSKGTVLSRLRRMDEAIQAFDAAATRCVAIGSDSLLPVIETALLDKALVAGASGDPRSAVKTVTQVLDQEPEPTPRNRLRGLFIRAFWHFEADDTSLGQHDIASARHIFRNGHGLELLPDCESYLAKSIDGLSRFTIPLGEAQILGLVKASPSKDLPLALATALDQELGHEPRVSVEVREVALNIRRDLKVLRENHPTAHRRDLAH